MALTQRGRTVLAALAVAVVVVAIVGVLLLAPRGSGAPAQTASGGDPGTPRVMICPLTGRTAKGGAVPNRPALAVKVENLPAARPQTGLSWADIIYEEPVEAGITRFIVVYQCQDASRIEPVRSGRLTDPSILTQFGRPVFGYAGAVPAVIKAVAAAGIIDANFTKAPQAYHRDPNRDAPHNLYTSTDELYAAAHRPKGIPQAVFTYDADVPSTGSAASSVHVPFSQQSDVVWSWSASANAWLRSYGNEPATYSDGKQMSSTDVVIQMVRIKLTEITDVRGVHSPEVIATGSGKAYVLRNGKVITGTWSRPKLSDLTVFKDANGDEIPLAPGRTWVELTPNTVSVTVSKA
jgi:hypothetical protein